MVVFGVRCWDWVVVSVDGWLLVVGGWWVGAVAVVSAVRSAGGGIESSVGRWRCGWVVCGFLRLHWGVPYFPVECIPVGLRYRVRDGLVDIFWVGQDDLASVQRGGLPVWWAGGSCVVLAA